MRKFLALIWLNTLFTLYAPFVVLAAEYPNDEYESADEACAYVGMDCDKADPEKVAEIEAEIDAEDAESSGETSSDENELPGMCPDPIGINKGKGLDAEAYTDESAKLAYENYYENFDAKLSEYQCGNITDTAAKKACQEALAATCGTPNPITHFIEKGDCSASGLVVTEINEVIAPEVKLDGNNKVVTVYSGLCCMAGEVKDGQVTTCDDTRTIYTTSYSDCTANAQSCEKRQWVIGSTGISIVKLMVKQIFTFAAIAVGSVCVSTIVLQAVRISVSGVSGDISEAKNKILQAIGGMVLLFLSGLLLYAINPEFFG